MRGAGFIVGLALCLTARHANAQTCTRPTDPAGYAGFAYGSARVSSFDTAHVRTWYATEGPHRVNTTSTRPDGVPDEAARSGEISEDALTRYASMGYRSPPFDEDATCGSNGGDGRLDVYLVQFSGADGSAVPERCNQSGNARHCASFILAESRFGERYPTPDQGIRTVLPHEVFHAVQNGYDADMDPFWAEGTAQWATKVLHPDLMDLERFLPSFFKEASRALDLPPSGPVAGYLYGSAIWPVYLAQNHGNDVVRAILEAQGVDGAPSLSAADSVLRGLGSALGIEFTRFASWNAATGTRATNLGYRDAASYPMIEPRDFPEGSLRGATSGLASFYYRLKVDSEKLLALEADPTRTSVTIVPLDAGIARVDQAVSLTSAEPARIRGESIIVVSGITTNRRDASFALSVSDPPKEPPPGPNPPQTSDGGGGCAVSAHAESWSGGGLVALIVGLTLLRWGRRPRCSPPSCSVSCNAPGGPS